MLIMTIVMEEGNGRIMELVDDVKEYGKAKLQLLGLIVTEKAAKSLSSIVANIILALLIIFFIIFGSIAGGLALGNLVNSYALGFLMVAGVYLIVILLAIVTKKSFLLKPFTNMFVKIIINILDDSDDEGDNKEDK